MCHELFTACDDALKIVLQVGRGRESPACITQPPDSSWLEHSICLEKNHPGIPFWLGFIPHTPGTHHPMP